MRRRLALARASSAQRWRRLVPAIHVGAALSPLGTRLSPGPGAPGCGPGPPSSHFCRAETMRSRRSLARAVGGPPAWRVPRSLLLPQLSALSAGGCEEGFLASSPPASPGGSPKGSRPGSPLPTPQAPRVDLQGAELWKRFHEIGTEMIITKAGR